MLNLNTVNHVFDDFFQPSEQPSKQSAKHSISTVNATDKQTKQLNQPNQ